MAHEALRRQLARSDDERAADGDDHHEENVEAEAPETKQRQKQNGQITQPEPFAQLESGQHRNGQEENYWSVLKPLRGPKHERREKSSKQPSEPSHSAVA